MCSHRCGNVSRTARKASTLLETETGSLLVSVHDAHHTLGIGRTAFYGLIGEGQIPVIKIGRRTLVAVSALKAFVENRTKETA